MNDNPQMSEQEAEEILRGLADQKDSVQRFFRDIIKSDDTTKTGSLDVEEIGISPLPLRPTKELETFCREVWDQETWADYFKKMAEVQTSTSLSRDAILIKLAVTNKKEFADVTSHPKKNGGWFKKKGG